MKVKGFLCGALGVTEGKEYEVVKETSDSYVVINDFGQQIKYFKWVFGVWNFEIIENKMECKIGG